jgi:hypothetical protein
MACLFSCALITAQAQKITLPLKGSNVLYEGTVKVNHNYNGDFICSKLKTWVIGATKQFHLNVEGIQDEGCTIVLSAKTAVDKDGTFKDVDCSFNLVVNLTETGLNYQLTNLVFQKNNHDYSVNEVYVRYLKNDPYVKANFENKQAALRRHEYLLNAMNKKVLSLTASLQKYLSESGIAP